MIMKGTNEQEEIWNEIANGDSHVMVYAGAGTGKTFTIVQSAESVSGKKGFLAFNRSIANELGNKLPSDCEAMTFHIFNNCVNFSVIYSCTTILHLD